MERNHMKLENEVTMKIKSQRLYRFKENAHIYCFSIQPVRPSHRSGVALNIWFFVVLTRCTLDKCTSIGSMKDYYLNVYIFGMFYMPLIDLSFEQRTVVFFSLLSLQTSINSTNATICH